MIGIYDNSELVGFFAVRKFSRIRYMAYFAVCSEKRSSGIGSKALHLLKDFYPDCQIINEFETPDESNGNNSIRLRRRDFYLRNGFCETGWYSFYDETEFDMQEFRKFIAYLNSIVPDHIPQPYQKKSKA